MSNEVARIFIVCIQWSDQFMKRENLDRLMSVLPSDIQDRLHRFYHAEDSWRSLIGHLLPRYWLIQNKIQLEQIRFGKTEHGKPLILRSPKPLTYNVTHDSDMVAIVCGSGEHVGIDVMRVALPRKTNMDEFVEFVTEQLTEQEKKQLEPGAADEPTRLLRLYRMWTVKEAYTKALGEGLGYEFARIEYDVVGGNITVDGQVPRGWEITSFVTQHASDAYVVSTARQIDGDQASVLHLDNPPNGLVEFVEVNALAECVAPSV